jgi:hypothetical protein
MLIPPVGMAMPTIGRRPGGGMPGSRVGPSAGDAARAAVKLDAMAYAWAAIRSVGVLVLIATVVVLVLAGHAKYL